MKQKFLTLIILIVLTLFSLNSFINTSNFAKKPQSEKNKITTGFDYKISTQHERTIRKSKLMNANSLKDLIEGYAENWIIDYKFVEISTKLDNFNYTELGYGLKLNNKQKRVLKQAPISSELLIRVVYNTKNDISNTIEENEMNVYFTVLPETPAVNSINYDNLITYFSKELEVLGKPNPMIAYDYNIRFTINKKGKPENLKFIKHTGNEYADEHIKTAIKRMPDWSPARDKNNNLIPQNLELKISSDKINGC